MMLLTVGFVRSFNVKITAEGEKKTATICVVAPNQWDPANAANYQEIEVATTQAIHMAKIAGVSFEKPKELSKSSNEVVNKLPQRNFSKEELLGINPLDDRFKSIMQQRGSAQNYVQAVCGPRYNTYGVTKATHGLNVEIDNLTGDVKSKVLADLVGPLLPRGFDIIEGVKKVGHFFRGQRLTFLVPASRKMRVLPEGPSYQASYDGTSGRNEIREEEELPRQQSASFQAQEGTTQFEE
jgi:hypothetical protein